MARLVLVALALAGGAAAAPASADDYGGERMPQYGDYAAGAPLNALAALDYRGHSPDAPASLDYKYEEDAQRGNSEKHPKDIDEVETWKKRLGKQRSGRRDGEDPAEEDGAAAGPAAEQPRRAPRRRARHQAEPERRRRTRRPRAGHYRARSFDYLDSVDYRRDNNKILEDESVPFARRDTTERIIRRKPRDRLFVAPLNGAMNSDEEIEPDRKLKDDMRGGGERDGGERDGGERDGGGEERAPLAPARTPAPLVEPAASEEEFDDAADERPLRGKHKPSKTYHDYGEYYDMNRLIKNKLPMLLRRTTTREPPPPPTAPEPGPSSSVPSSTDLLRLLWTARRAHSPPPPTTPPPPEREVTTATVTAASTSTTRGSPTDTARSSSELSLAERSRLSILKKAQKKESALGSSTKKPAVLLQVTSQMPTVVMVAPAAGGDPWVRARVAEEESPERLERVKRLMRRKLVARARSIADLTDNWDDMVCDYIDVALLDAPPGAAAPLAPGPRALAYLAALAHILSARITL